MTSNNSNSNSGSQPFTWILIPLLSFIVLGLIIVAYRVRVRRHRRRDARSWTGQPPGARQGASSGRSHRRRSPWAGSRSEEGLNELGEAPPPYDGKKNDSDDALAMRDLEAGGSPPEYPAAPGSAVVRDSRRSTE